VIVFHQPGYGTLIKRVHRVLENGQAYDVRGTQIASTDSRNFGPVPQNQVTGKVIVSFRASNIAASCKGSNRHIQPEGTQPGLKADLLLLLTAIIWGFAFVAQRVGMSHMGPFTFNGIRFSLGALALIPFLVWQRRKAPNAPRFNLKPTGHPLP
jgi:hypothetical protein